MQHSHESTPFSKRDFPIVLICDGVNGPANIGSLFRISEAFGVSEIIFGNAEIDLDSSRMKRTARDTHLKVPCSISEDLHEATKHLREGGYLIVALEISKHSKPIKDFKWNRSEKLAMIVGNEANGISEDILSTADMVFHIELFGENSSINVAHATAIALYQLTGL
ncbi:MAG: TrmH family RNA methyltransferase [Bacteroidia bacterium]|nr:TrmH family RNA methyltransferase [Bacteroidia bacterium]MBT8274588.1 TrmH family RNA methyltransferase [Bacteroidia bacterium]NNF32432.1 TrmH family RNA methyltransferase [Flavobacteriaceae bacterium]NNJ82150.1 TrmH family RNA methyltransferase [Flavobacteriaceae bacterium]NNM07800.1 TrmH family RNA methyltransferase [Flavobacteriaceae bacterium]